MKKLFVFVAMLTIFASNAFAEPRLLKWDKVDHPECSGYIVDISGDNGDTYTEVLRIDSPETVSVVVEAPTDKLYLYRISAIFADRVETEYVSGTWYDKTKFKGPPSGLNNR